MTMMMTVITTTMVTMNRTAAGKDTDFLPLDKPKTIDCRN